jgi:nitroreductase
MMEAFEAVRTMLAVREYEDRPIPEELVRRIVEAAWLTASSMNKQPWHFIVVEDRDTLKRLGQLVSTGPYIAQAALAIVVAIEESRFSVSDASRAIQSMMLTAWSDGVGSNWAGFLGLPEVKSFLDIPDEMTVLAVVPFGYPTRDIGKGQKKRKPLGQVAHRGKFGQPFE